MAKQQWLVSVLASCVMVAGATSVQAQARFEALTRDVLPVLPGLEIVTIRDNALQVCYTLFMMTAPSAAPAQAQIPPPSVQDAEAERDRRLSELTADLDRTQTTATPGTIPPDRLRYEWEAMKAQSELERVLREAALARLEARLKEIIDARRLAVSGPLACNVQPAPPAAGK
jgi:hypothetical protein